MILPVKEFRKALDIVGLAISSNSMVPVCDCVVIETEGENVRMTATNLRETISHTFKTDTRIARDEIILANYKSLSDYIKLLRETEVSITSTTRVIDKHHKQVSVHIQAGKAKAIIEGEDLEDRLSLDLGKINHEIELDYSLLEEITKKCLPFESTDEFNFSLHGVNIDLSSEKILVLAGNGEVLTKLEKPGTTEPFAVHISKSLKLITSLYSGLEKITLKISDKKFRVETESGWMQGTLIEEKFPDISAVLQKYNEGKKVTIDRVELISEVKKAVLFAQEKHKEIHLGFSENLLKVATKNQAHGTFYENEIKCDCLSEAIIHVDGNYLIRALQSCESDEVTIEHFEKQNEPIKIIDGEYTNLISPIMPSFELKDKNQKGSGKVH